MLAAGMVFAQAAPKPGAGQGVHSFARRQGVHQRMMQALNLTDAQKQQAKSIFQQSRESMKPVFRELRQNRQALEIAVKANDQTKIEQLAAKQGHLRGKMMTARAEAMAKVYQILTPEQRSKADQMMQNAKSHMAARRNG